MEYNENKSRCLKQKAIWNRSVGAYKILRKAEGRAPRRAFGNDSAAALSLAQLGCCYVPATARTLGSGDGTNHHIAVTPGSGSRPHNCQLQGHNTSAGSQGEKCCLYAGSWQWDSICCRKDKSLNGLFLCLFVSRAAHLHLAVSLPSRCVNIWRGKLPQISNRRQKGASNVPSSAIGQGNKEKFHMPIEPESTTSITSSNFTFKHTP